MHHAQNDTEVRTEIVIGTDEHRVNDEAIAALARLGGIYTRVLTSSLRSLIAVGHRRLSQGQSR